jgi:hypothetical protein
VSALAPLPLLQLPSVFSPSLVVVTLYSGVSTITGSRVQFTAFPTLKCATIAAFQDRAEHLTVTQDNGSNGSGAERLLCGGGRQAVTINESAREVATEADERGGCTAVSVARALCPLCD